MHRTSRPRGGDETRIVRFVSLYGITSREWRVVNRERATPELSRARLVGLSNPSIQFVGTLCTARELKKTPREKRKKRKENGTTTAMTTMTMGPEGGAKKPNWTKQQESKIRRIFNKCDADGNGSVSVVSSSTG